MPLEAEYLWKWFQELHYARRRTALGGAEPLSYTDVLSWAHLTKRYPEPEDIRAIFSLDLSYMATQAAATTQAAAAAKDKVKEPEHDS